MFVGTFPARIWTYPWFIRALKSTGEHAENSESTGPSAASIDEDEITHGHEAANFNYKICICCAPQHVPSLSGAMLKSPSSMSTFLPEHKQAHSTHTPLTPMLHVLIPV